MRRRIIELGHNCMVMSLPSKWVKKHDLKKGVELDVSVEDNQLVILPEEERKKPLEIEIDIENFAESAIRTTLVNLYRIGYDKIHLNYTGDKDKLNEIVNDNLLGFEIFNEKDDRYIIESVSEPNYDDFDKIIRKIFFMMMSAINEIGKPDVLQQVMKIQRYDNFLKRCIMKRIIDIKEKTFMWQFLSELIHVSREFYHFSKVLDKKYNFCREEKNFLDMMKSMLGNEIAEAT